MKELCRYTAIDIETGEVLTAGVKYKDFSEMISTATFRCFPCFWRKISEYGRLKVIKGRTCYIVYWTGEKKKQATSCVFALGKHLHLRGDLYSDEWFDFSFFLRAYGLFT